MLNDSNLEGGGEQKKFGVFIKNTF